MNRRTKIIASIGPASASDAVLKDMIEAGMDVARVNLSHGTVDDGLEIFHRIRAVSESLGRTVGIMADLPGPKVRIGKLPEAVLIEPGSQILLSPDEGPSGRYRFTVDYAGLLTDVRVGDRLAIGDGSIILQVVEHVGDALKAEVLFGGTVQGSPGLHIPSDRLKLSTPTPHDLKLLDAFVEAGVDMVALSFVRSAHDIRRVGTEPAPGVRSLWRRSRLGLRLTTSKASSWLRVQ